MKSSCDLLARSNAIPFYSQLSSCSRGFLPTKEAINDSVKHLRGLSTYVHQTGSEAFESIDTIKKMVARIEKNLGLEPLE